MTRPRVEAVAAGDGWGIRADLDGWPLLQPRPVRIELDDATERSRSVGYGELRPTAEGLTGTASVELAPGCRIEVRDEWSVEDVAVVLHRSARVVGSAELGFGTMIALPTGLPTWLDAEAFVPGVAYGDAPRVAPLALAGKLARSAGIADCLIREDRMAAPVFGLRRGDGSWLAVLHRDPDGATIGEDGRAVDGGETLVDERLAFASLGGVQEKDGLSLGLCFPGTEGELTYSSGGLPLLQLREWRRRYHPARDGLVQRYSVAFRSGRARDTVGFFAGVWRCAWEELRPSAEPVDIATVVRDCTAVLADQAVATPGHAGIPLEADAVEPTRSNEDDSAVMGFVGANTDAGSLLLRVGDALGGEDGQRFRSLGERVLDTFTRIPLAPPAAEGFSAWSGEPTTYRSYRGAPAVYARSIAEGCLAVLDAWRWERDRGTDRDDWLAWARQGGDWLLAAQGADGSLPRAWEAGTGRVLDDSDSAPYVVVPFLVALASVTGERRSLDAAVAAADFGWRSAGSRGWYAGATLDNPDVVDKEAAILSTEGFLDLFDATGDALWLARAESAARVAETWIVIWDVPMPLDADESEIHWKPGVSTIGHQLITTGCSMTDGFLAVNASAFARLYRATGDAHWLDVARLVTHGTTTMLAREGRVFDLRGPGWQQEHWSFAPRRGYGLNRRWLPWVPVAHVRGIHRVEDLGEELARLVLAPKG